MLGSLARWLRLLGFDAAYAGNALSDPEVMERAEREDRFIATCDFPLVQRCLKKGQPALLLKTGPLEEQLPILLMHSGAVLDPQKFFTRCTECGALLSPASLEDVKEKVPAAVQALHTEYWRCPACGHVYWEGSHVSAIEKRILDLVRRMSEAQPSA